MSELIINAEVYDEDSYREVLSSVKDLAHAFIDLDDFENAGACVVQLLQLQLQHDQALHPHPPQDA